MYTASFTSRFARDVKACQKRRWDTVALRRAMNDLLVSDEHPLDHRYKDHALSGGYSGYRSMHVDSAPNPPKDKWVLMYRIVGHEIVFTRTGTHDAVYGK